MKSIHKTFPALFALVCCWFALNGQETTQGAAKSKKKDEAKTERRWGAAPAAEFAPQRVILGWTGDPAHSQAVSWRTEKRADTPQVQFAVANADPGFPASSR